jgi:hypothetical protein
MLYTYSKTTLHSDVSFLYNLHNITSNTIDTSLKFFYPVPYAALGVGTCYDTCNIVSLTENIQLLCLLSPAPQTRGMLKVNAEPYYANNNITKSCKDFTYDLCTNPSVMKKYNLQGYIGLAHEDTISHGTQWGNILKSNNLINKEIINTFIKKSCLDSSKAFAGNHLTIQKDIDIPRKLFNRYFGIPEIVLSPFKSSFFKEIVDIPTIQENISMENKELITQYFNYKALHIVPVDSIKDTLDRLADQITQNPQTPLFHNYIPESESPYNVFHPILPANDYTFADVNFLENYTNNENPAILVKGGVFETVLYNMLNTDPKSSGGGRKRITRKNSFKIAKNKKGKTRKANKNKYTRKIGKMIVIKKNKTLKLYNNKPQKIDSIGKRGGKVDIMNTMNEPLLTTPLELQKNMATNKNTNMDTKPAIIIENEKDNNDKKNQVNSAPNIVLQITKNNIPIMYLK